MVRKCCGECVQFTYLQPSKDSEALKTNIGSNGSVVNFPLYGTLVTEKFQNLPYFPVIESPGILYIRAIVPASSSANAVMMSVFAAWPVLVITIIMAVLSGIVMWALESYWNPDEFPHSFYQGSWEGFWWAFVSMTTVGMCFYFSSSPFFFTCSFIRCDIYVVFACVLDLLLRSKFFCIS